ncbi:MAG TPA: hypothetical protein VIM34_04520 [Burkholderiaceae bacterium]|jgi:hypothetical protein
MARDPNVPDAFDVYTLVLLRRPPDAPSMSDEELETLQRRHLAYRAELRRQPFRTPTVSSANAERCPTTDPGAARRYFTMNGICMPAM